MAEPHVLVVGAGIAGLAVGLALARRGIACEILEQAAALEDLGAGVQISPNGFRVLAALGLGDALARSGTRAEAVCLIDGLRGGAPLARLDLTASPYWLIHRADLVDLLAQAARDAGVVIRLGQRVTGVTTGVTTGAPTRLALADGTSRTAALVIGADGLHSRAHAALNGPVTAEFTHHVAWRATLPMVPGGRAEARVFMGPGRHLVSYPVRGGTLRNIVAVAERESWTAEGWSHSADPAELRQAFASFCPKVRYWLDQVDATMIWGLHARPVAQHWHGPGLALLGDAAHPTLPFLAQGANMALEDAWVLASVIAGGQPMATYQQARRARTRRIVAAAAANGGAYHLSGLGRPLAHLALRLVNATAPGLMLRRYTWVYHHDVTRDFP